MLNKKDLRKVIEEGLDSVSVELWQDKPYTAVRVIAKYNGCGYDRVGFAKVQYPDEWDTEYGAELAKDKAVAKITKAIANGEERERRDARSKQSR